MTYFSGPAVAANYAASRPYFHPVVIDHIRRTLAVRRVARALDVACGTGQSSRALADLAATVIGSDRSRDMLAAAAPHPRVDYVVAEAEAQPFAGRSFPLLTVALAFHWFDRSAFLAEACRLLIPGGTLVIYNNVFRAEMVGNPAFRDWFRGPYLGRYPSPARDNTPLGDAAAVAAGFRFLARREYVNDVAFTLPELTRYLMSQTNVIGARPGGGTAQDETEAWLARELAPYFRHPSETFRFGGPIWYLKRS